MSPSNFKYDPYMNIPNLITIGDNHYQITKDGVLEVEAELDEMGLAKEIKFRILLPKFTFDAVVEREELDTTPDEDGNVSIGKIVIPKELFELCVEKWVK